MRLEDQGGCASAYASAYAVAILADKRLQMADYARANPAHSRVREMARQAILGTTEPHFEKCLLRQHQAKAGK